MQLAYIVAPFGAATEQAIARNVRRAAALCKRAVAWGCAPICVHPAIQAGCYGDDNNPEDRERGLRIDVRLIEAVADGYGAIYVLLAEDGYLSAGSQVEIDAYLEYAGPRDFLRPIRVYEPHDGEDGLRFVGAFTVMDGFRRPSTAPTKELAP